MNRTTTNGFACGSAIYRALQNCLTTTNGFACGSAIYRVFQNYLVELRAYYF